MGIVADTRGGLWSGLGWRPRREVDFLGARPAPESCALRFASISRAGADGIPDGRASWQHGAGAGIVVRSAGAEHDHGRRQQDGHEVSQENG